MKKKCSRCKEVKFLDQFYKNANKTLGVSGNCKECQKEYNRLHYPKTKEKWAESRRFHSNKVLQENKQFLLEYLSSHPCVDCGNNDIRVLEFDHLPGTTKLKDISALLSYTRATLVAEIAKCQVLCANCHRIKTFERAGSWRDIVFTSKV